MFYLRIRMYLLIAALFAVIYAVMTVIGVSVGIANFNFYLVLSVVLMYIQYMVGPKIVEWSMKVRYVGEASHPKLHRMVNDLAMKAGIPKPKVGVSPINIPNAFAFGRSVADGRVCVTQGILNILNDEELKAVLGHEMSHIKNRDMLTMTILSVLPLILYRVAWHLLWFGGASRRREGQANTALVGLAALVFYFLTNLLVLYASRIREYFADRGSVDLGNKPAALASALYKLVYSSARVSKEALKEVEGVKAFFANDPSRAVMEISQLRDVDIDKSGTIDDNELELLKKKELNLSAGDKMMEAFSTHPNMLKRIKQLSSIG